MRDKPLVYLGTGRSFLQFTRERRRRGLDNDRLIFAYRPDHLNGLHDFEVYIDGWFDAASEIGQAMVHELQYASRRDAGFRILGRDEALGNEALERTPVTEEEMAEVRESLARSLPRDSDG